MPSAGDSSPKTAPAEVERPPPAENAPSGAAAVSLLHSRPGSLDQHRYALLSALTVTLVYALWTLCRPYGKSLLFAVILSILLHPKQGPQQSTGSRREVCMRNMSAVQQRWCVGGVASPQALAGRILSVHHFFMYLLLECSAFAGLEKMRTTRLGLVRLLGGVALVETDAALSDGGTDAPAGDGTIGSKVSSLRPSTRLCATRYGKVVVLAVTVVEVLLIARALGAMQDLLVLHCAILAASVVGAVLFPPRVFIMYAAPTWKALMAVLCARAIFLAVASELATAMAHPLLFGDVSTSSTLKEPEPPIQLRAPVPSPPLYNQVADAAWEVVCSLCSKLTELWPTAAEPPPAIKWCQPASCRPPRKDNLSQTDDTAKMISKVLVGLDNLYSQLLLVSTLQYLRRLEHTVLYYALDKWFAGEESIPGVRLAHRIEDRLVGCARSLLATLWHLVFFHFAVTTVSFQLAGVSGAATAGLVAGALAFFPLTPKWVSPCSGAMVYALATRDLPAAGCLLLAVWLECHDEWLVVVRRYVVPGREVDATGTDTLPYFLVSTTIVLGFMAYGAAGVVLGPLLGIIALAAFDSWPECARSTVSTTPT